MTTNNFTFNFSLVMVNLFIALIITDIEELRREGNIRETLNKAFDIISYGQIMKSWEGIISLCYTHRPIISTSHADICVHDICFDCDKIKVPTNIRDELQSIARKKITKGQE